MSGALLIDGKSLAAAVRRDISAEASRLSSLHGGAVPGLCAVLCGGRRDARTYVRLKRVAAAQCGFRSARVDLPAAATQRRVEAEIARLNASAACHGIIVQLPLPPHIDTRAALAKISPEKDADALLPVHVGMLHSNGSCAEPPLVPCTPAAILELLRRSGVRIEGKRAVVLGRSNLVGAPAAALLARHNATVTVVHSRTPPGDVEEIVKASDIVVSAVGKPNFVRGEWIKEGAAVIDAGTTPVDDPTKKRGYRLVGDVCFEEAKMRAGFITPVPGGVGPMTIAMLLRNTLICFKRSLL